jgi:hypothetical protein
MSCEKRTVLWVVTSCSSENARRFGGTYRLYLLGRRISQARNQQGVGGKQSDVLLHYGEAIISKIRKCNNPPMKRFKLLYSAVHAACFMLVSHLACFSILRMEAIAIQITNYVLLQLN